MPQKQIPLTTRQRLASLALGGLMLMASSYKASADQIYPPHACEREMARAALQNHIPLDVLYAVGLTETGSKDGFNPFDLDVDGVPIHPTSLNQALNIFETKMASGAHFIDIGCMQINYQWHKDEFPSLAQMFNPKSNVSFAARFLRTLYQHEGSWTLAVARYNAGPNNNIAQQKYVCAVLNNLVKSGIGKWTAAAASFCSVRLAAAIR